MNELNIEEVYFHFFRRRAERRIWPRGLSEYDDLSDLPARLGSELGEVLEEAWYDTREYVHALLLQDDPRAAGVAWRIVKELEGGFLALESGSVVVQASSKRVCDDQRNSERSEASARSNESCAAIQSIRRSY